MFLSLYGKFVSSDSLPCTRKMKRSSDSPTPPPPPRRRRSLQSQFDWRTAENSAAYLLGRLEALRAKNPRLSLLDVGAGSGSLSITLAQRIPDGRVTAIDINGDILPRGRNYAEIAGVTNISFQQADVLQLPFADNTFDVTHCHHVLCHLKDPATALREMLRVTKPGGVIAAREGDCGTESIWPEIPGMDKFHNFLVDLVKLAGGDPYGGRKLVSWALQAGASRKDITMSHGTWSYSEADERKLWAQTMVRLLRDNPIRESAIKAGKTTEEDLQEMAEAWESWQEQDDANMSIIHAEIIIQQT